MGGDDESAANWIMDSTASHHMTGDRRSIQSTRLVTTAIAVRLPGGFPTTSFLKGVVPLHTDGAMTCLLTDVIYVPGLRSNIVSLRRVYEHGAVLSLDSDRGLDSSGRPGQTTGIAGNGPLVIHARRCAKGSLVCSATSLPVKTTGIDGDFRIDNWVDEDLWI